MTEENKKSRLDDMLERYGEVCKQTIAAQILGVVPRTIYRMMEEGRLRRVGKFVDVHSIYEFICGEHTTPMPTARKQQAARKHTTAGFMSRSEFMAAAQRTRR